MKGGVDAEMEEVADQDEGKTGHESDRTAARLSCKCKQTLSTLSRSTGHSRPWLHLCHQSNSVDASLDIEPEQQQLCVDNRPPSASTLARKCFSKAEAYAVAETGRWHDRTRYSHDWTA